VNPLETTPGVPRDAAADRGGGGRRFLWHAIAWLLAAAVVSLIFASYRQPDVMLDLAGMRLCVDRAPFGPVA
jgi:hypothetical protein